MKEDDNKRNERLSSILSKGSVPKAPSNLSHRVLEAWKLKQNESLVIEPLIPKWAWWVIGFVVFSLSTTLILMDPTTIGTSVLDGFMSNLRPQFSIPSLSFQGGPIMLSALAVFCIVIAVNIFMLKKNRPATASE